MRSALLEASLALFWFRLLVVLNAALLVPAFLHAAEQSISWTSPAEGAVLLLNQPYPLEATASSGLPLSFRVRNGPAIISGNIVTVTNVGTVILAADQLGDATNAPVRKSRVLNRSQVQVRRGGQWPGFLRGSPAGLSVHNGRLYVAQGLGGMAVFDVRNPSNPIRLGEYPASDLVRAVTVTGDFAYLADSGAGLQILDVRDAANPIRVGGFKPTYANDVEVVGGVAYVADGAGLQILDVSNQASPVRVGASGSVAALQVVGALAYLAHYDGVSILDVSDPTNPTGVGGIITGSLVYGVNVVDNLAYLAAGDKGLQIVDVSSPASPVRVGELRALGPALSVEVIGNLAYLASWTGGLEIVDVSGPAHPVRVGNFKIAGETREVKVVGNLAFVADGRAGVHILDVTVPTNPVRVGGIDCAGESLDVRLVGDVAFVADGDAGLQILDFSKPANPKRLGGMPTSGFARAVDAGGDMAYVLDSLEGLKAINVSVPSAPVILGGYNPNRFCWNVRLEDRHAYLATSSFTPGAGGLEIIDVSNPANLQWLGNANAGVETRAGDLVGNLAYVAAADAGLQIVDVSNPSNPVRVGGFDTPGSALDVQTVGNLVFAADWNAGLQILDATNPAAPMGIGHFNTGNKTVAVRVVGNLAYVLDWDIGLAVLDVSQPTAPMLIGQFETGGYASAIELRGDLAYVAAGSGGLQVLQLREGIASTLGFEPRTKVSMLDSPIRLGSVGNSGLPIAYTVVSGPATLADNQLSLTGLGSVVVRADLPGNGQFLPLTVEWTMTVTKPPQALTWNVPSEDAIMFLNQPHPLAAVASSGLPVTFRVKNGPAVIAGGFLTATNVGTIVVVAEQGGDATHADVSQTRLFNRSEFQVQPVSQSSGLLGPALGLNVQWNRAYAAFGQSGLVIFDTSNPVRLTQLGRFSGVGYARSVQVVDHLAYVASHNSGFQILSVSNPAAPARVGGTFSVTAGTPMNVQVVGNLAYVSADYGGLHILNVGDPATPLDVSRFTTSGYAHAVQVADNLAYVAASDSGLQILDVSNPANPVAVGAFDTAGRTLDVQVVGNLAYLADEAAGIRVVDVSVPTAPVGIGALDTPGTAQSVQVVGNFVYVADGDAGMQILDVSEPSRPVRIGGFDTSGSAHDVQVAGEYAYIADHSAVRVMQLREGLAQNLSLALPESGTVDESPIALTTSNRSGLPVTYRVISGPAILNGDQLNLTGIGAVVVRAEQGGNEQFLPASVERTVKVTAARPALSFLRSGAQVILSWPTTNSTGYLLEQASLLSEPADWRPSPAPIADDSTSKSVTLPAAEHYQFFRLHKP